MHQLFSQVLDQRDLSRAGDLFSLEDTDIEACLSQALDQIKAISCPQVSEQNQSHILQGQMNSYACAYP